MKKLLLLLFFSVTFSLNTFAYPIYSGGMAVFTSYFDNYFSNKYWVADWSSFAAWVPWDFTDYTGYSTVYALFNQPYYHTLFEEMNTAKVNGTLSPSMIDNFYDVVYEEVVLNGTTPKPIISTVSTPAALCAGANLSITIPTITSTTTLSSQTWQIETAVGSGVFADAALPFAIAFADNGKKIRYSATNTYGTRYSNEVLISVLSSPQILSVVPAERCGNGNVTLSATPSSGATVAWYANASGGSSLSTSLSYTANISSTKNYYVQANNSCGSSARTAVLAKKNTTAPTISSVTPAQSCGAGSVELQAVASSGTINWFAASTGGSSLASGASYTTPILSVSEDYYVSATNSCGTSASRTKVDASIKVVPIIISFDNGTACGAGDVALSAFASSGSVNWYDAPTGGTSLHTGTNYSPTVSTTSVFYVDASNGGCTTVNRTAVTAIVSGANTQWTGAQSTDWNEPLNWTNGVPCSESKVIIPDVATASNYPTINSTVYCDTIVFEAGGALKGLEYLEYNKAFVKMTLQRDRWYTLSSPLKEMYSGDYYFEGTPITYMRLFDDVDPDLGEIAVGTWTKSFASLSVPLSTGYGFAFRVDTLGWDRSAATAVKSTSHSDVNLSFPKTNANGSLMRTVTPYSGLNGKLNPYKVTTLVKDSAFAYRFAMEDASNNMPSTISISVKPGLNLIANPLMTHLDFNALLASNSTKINNKVKFWNGSSFDSYLITDQGMLSTSLSSGTGVIIAPMQGFFVDCITGAASDIDINVANHFVADNSTSLRTCSVPRNVMHVVAETEVAKTSICIAKGDAASNGFGADDDYKLFSSLPNVPEIYTISGGKSLGINQFKDYPYTTPLSISCAKQGLVNLKFYGVGSFDEDAIVELINSRTGERIDLKENSEYNFEYDGTNASGELFISYRTASVSTDIANSNASDDIQVYADGKKVHIISSPDDMIQDVAIWNPAGCQIMSISDLNTPTYSPDLVSCPQFYVVKVTTNNKCKTVKVLIK